MASIKTSAVVEDIRGSVGGNTFSRNANGAYVRGRIAPVNPKTVKQSNVRGEFGDLMASWRSLTPEQQNSWELGRESFPYQNRLGETKTYTASQLYAHLNRVRQSLGLALLAACPLPASFGAASDLNVAAATFTSNAFTTLDLGFAGDEDLEAIVYATGPVSAGVNRPNRSSFKSLGGHEAVDNEFDIAAAYNSAMQTPEIQIGAAVFFIVKPVIASTGQLQEPGLIFKYVRTA